MSLGDFDIWKFLAGLGVFLVGMFFIEDSLKNLAGRTFKKIIRSYTNRPIKGIFAGTLITMILQSSSVVSLMVLAFVSSGILQLRNAIGIIFGTNLGTTFTGWIVVLLGFKFDIEGFVLPLLAIGGFAMILYSRTEKIKESGRFLLGIGLLFLGLDFMKTSIDAFSITGNGDVFRGLNTFLFFPIGLVLTAIIQSSSAAMVITLSALSSGMISMEAAACMVIGSDVGTTVTTIFGSIKGIPAKKRVMMSHVLLNVITAIVALSLIYPLLSFAQNQVGLTDELMVLVFFHSSFNLLGIAIMFPFIRPYSNFLERLFTNHQSTVSRFIQKVPVDVPEAANEALRNETTQLIDQAFQLNLQAFQISVKKFDFEKTIPHSDRNFSGSGMYLRNYEQIKKLEGEITSYFVEIQQKEMEHEEAERSSQYMSAVRNAMIAVKEFKDIEHNFHDLQNSSNDHKRSLFLFLQSRSEEFFLELYHCFEKGVEETMFEELHNLLHKNHDIYHDFSKKIYKKIPENKLSELEISTLMTINREIHHANKHLIIAVKNVVLDLKDAKNFNTLTDVPMN